MNVRMCVDLEVRETGHVNGKEEDETALQEMVAPLSLTDLAKPSNLASITVEASKSTKAIGGIAVRGATTIGSSTVLLTRIRFPCDSL